MIEVNWILIPANEQFLAVDYHPLKIIQALSAVRPDKEAGCMAAKTRFSF